MQRPLISVCIPTFHEENYILKAMENLSKQTVWNKCEVVIADYDPFNTPIEERPIYQILANANRDDYSKVTIVDVSRKGIGFARHTAIMNSQGMYIVNFDADTEFLYEDTIFQFIKTIQNNNYKIVMVTCPNTLSLNEIETSSPILMTYNVINFLHELKLSPIVFEPGLTMLRSAYDIVGGFRDVTQGEATFLYIDTVLKFGLAATKQLNRYPVMTSSRRVGTDFSKAVFAFDYGNAYRGSEKLKIN